MHAHERKAAKGLQRPQVENGVQEKAETVYIWVLNMIRSMLHTQLSGSLSLSDTNLYLVKHERIL